MNFDEITGKPPLKKMKRETAPQGIISTVSPPVISCGSTDNNEIVDTASSTLPFECNIDESTERNESNVLGECVIDKLENCRLNYSFYNVPCEELAQNLLGKILVRSMGNNVILKGRIVETECYPGGEDKASHSYNGKITPRNKPMFMKPGTTYVYFTYGMYFCFNISSQGDGAAVLVRSVEPLEGHEIMNLQRISKRMNIKKSFNAVSSKPAKFVSPIKPYELCNGPAKLCISFCIDDKKCNMQDLCSWESMWIESDVESSKVNFNNVIISTRIGINSVDAEWALKPLRYYILNNRSVSRRDKKKEQEKINLLQ